MLDPGGQSKTKFKKLDNNLPVYGHENENVYINFWRDLDVKGKVFTSSYRIYWFSPVLTWVTCWSRRSLWRYRLLGCLWKHHTQTITGCKLVPHTVGWFHWSKDTESSQNVSDHSATICMLLTPLKSALYIGKGNWAQNCLKISRQRRMDTFYVHSPRVKWGRPCDCDIFDDPFEISHTCHHFCFFSLSLLSRTRSCSPLENSRMKDRRRSRWELPVNSARFPTHSPLFTN